MVHSDEDFYDMSVGVECMHSGDVGPVECDFMYSGVSIFIGFVWKLIAVRYSRE